VEAALLMLPSEDPMLRWAAAGSLQMLPIQHRYALLARYIEDDTAAVRMEVAQMLAEVPLEQIGPGDAAQLDALFREYLHTLGRQADIPEAQLEMGVFLVARGMYEPAERAYRNALRMNAGLLAAYLNLADLYRLQGRDDDGRKLLLEAADVAPEEGAVWQALGLLETRAGNREQALAYLEKSAQLETTGIRHRYVYAVALHDAGREDAALALLKSLLRDAPDNPDLLLALATYSKTAGRDGEARRYGERLIELMPEDPGVRQFYETL
jgi:tetratricopeptide (TPR) repeat protein